MGSTRKVFSLLVLIISLISPQIFGLSDIINATQIITDGETLVSSNGMFELGFFSPGHSSNRYVGLWYKNITVRTVVWVANRGFPVKNRSGTLRVITPGLLVLINDMNRTIWSSNSSSYVRNPVAQLLDNGNIVVRDENDDKITFVWQSFDYPTDTYLQGMKLGWNLLTGFETYFSSWKSDDDPSPGKYSFHLNPTGFPQILLKKDEAIKFRTGPWNGVGFSGSPKAEEDPTYKFAFVRSENEVHYTDSLDRPVISRFTISSSGLAQRWTWVDRAEGWVTYLNMPGDICDTYNLCGPYGICDTGKSPSCGCLEKFDPKDPNGWVRADWSSGCVRRSNLSCEEDIFLKYSSVKLPDATYSWYNVSMTFEECKVMCLRDCSCMGFTQLDISRSRGSGCLIWYVDLVDIRRLSNGGQDIYIRMPSSESDFINDIQMKEKKLPIKLIVISIGSGVVVSCLINGSILLVSKRKRRGRSNEDIELPLFKFATIVASTNNFSRENMIGEGGFGPVYKGNLLVEGEVAIKRLSRTSRQGLEEFKNEVILISKLQHRNLVRLLGCCIEGEERMLLYEYLENKSLDYFVFDQNRRTILTWPKRFDIIMGIAKGLLYLHHDSRLKIIHRDLKTSNILLDGNLNPKISDFGLARIFGEDQAIGRTKRVVGTYGYMSPEYTIDGKFSAKSDIFSMGVVILEIVSGRKNRGFEHYEHYHNLLGHVIFLLTKNACFLVSILHDASLFPSIQAWLLWKENIFLELMDECCLNDTYIETQVKRCIQVGLLCVQNFADDRPMASSVLSMLGTDGAILPEPNEPGFFGERSSSSTTTKSSHNETMTITDLEAR